MTARPVLELEAAGLPSVVIGGPGNPIGLRELDLGHPSTRTVSSDATGRDGSVDRTLHHGPRSITAGCVTTDATFAEVNAVKAYLRPSVRATMTIRNLPGGAPPLIAAVRGSTGAGILTAPDLAAGAVEVTRPVWQWVAPAGVLESLEEHSTIVRVAGAAGATPGRAYDLTFDREYPDAAVAGSAPVVNAGSTDASPILRLFGPITDPIVSHLELGRALSFPGLSIASGDYLEIDPRNRTIRYNGSPADSRYGDVDWGAPSRWFELPPGVSTIRYVGGNSDAVTQCAVIWRDTYL